MQTKKILEVMLVKRGDKLIHIKAVESREQLDIEHKNILWVYPPSQGYEILFFNNLKPI